MDNTKEKLVERDIREGLGKRYFCIDADLEDVFCEEYGSSEDYDSLLEETLDFFRVGSDKLTGSELELTGTGLLQDYLQIGLKDDDGLFTGKPGSYIPLYYFLGLEEGRVIGVDELNRRIESEAKASITIEIVTGEHDERRPYGEGYCYEHMVDTEKCTRISPVRLDSVKGCFLKGAMDEDSIMKAEGNYIQSVREYVGYVKGEDYGK